MKLVIVIVSNKDLTNVLSSTVEEGYFSTKISTQGMFLENGQTTVLFGVKEEEVEKLFDIIEKSVLFNLFLLISANVRLLTSSYTDASLSIVNLRNIVCFI